MLTTLAVSSWSSWLQQHGATRSLSRCAAIARTPPPLLQVLDPDDDDADGDVNELDAPQERSSEEMDAFRAQLMRQMGGQFGGSSADLVADVEEEAEEEAAVVEEVEEAGDLDKLSVARLALQAAIQVEDYAEAARLKKEIEASEERTVVEEQEDGLSAEPSSATTTAELTPGRPLGLASCPSAHELWAGGAESAQRDSILVFPGLATKAECAALVEASTAAAAGHREACLASSVPCSGYVRLLTAAAAKRASDGSPTSGETVQLMLRPRRYALEPPTLCAASDAMCEAILLRLLSLLDAEMPSLVLDHFGAGWPLGLRELYEVS